MEEIKKFLNHCSALAGSVRGKVGEKRFDTSVLFVLMALLVMLIIFWGVTHSIFAEILLVCSAAIVGYVVLRALDDFPTRP